MDQELEGAQTSPAISRVTPCWSFAGSVMDCNRDRKGDDTLLQGVKMVMALQPQILISSALYWAHDERERGGRTRTPAARPGRTRTRCARREVRAHSEEASGRIMEEATSHGGDG